MGLFCVAKSFLSSAFLRSAFLRSGSLDGLLALGEDGLPIYASAVQLRETLRLRGQQQLLDCLAIPQPHEQGERLDWYAPIEGKVTTWAAADDSQRASALRQLEQCQATVADISRRAQRAEKAAQKLFGMLLAKAIQFPDQNHVYLVGEKAVLTFWGFVKLDEKSRADPLDCLRPPPPAPEPVMIPVRHDPIDIPPTVARQSSPRLIGQPDIPEPASVSSMESGMDETVQRAQPETTTALPKTKGRRLRRRLWWILPALALAAILVFQLYGYLAHSPEWPPVSAPVVVPQVVAPTTPMSATPAGQTNHQTDSVPAATGRNRPTTAISPAPAADGSGVPVGGSAAASNDVLSGTAQAAGNAAEGKMNAGPAYATANEARASADGKAVAGAENTALTQGNRSAAANDESAAGATHSSIVPTEQVTASQMGAPLSPSQMKNALRLPAEAVRAGSITFFNGRWQVSVDSKNPVTGGKAVSFEYQVKNGGGVAKIRYGDGTICRADVHAGLMKSGNLVIKSRQNARCSDGSTYRMPQIVCKQSLTGIADCQSRYDNGQAFPTQIKRENVK
jgi:hypothetical protein